MNKKIITLVALVACLPIIVFATGDHETSAEAGKYLVMTGRENDFMPRIFNFLIFAGILWYLIANPIKNFLTNRSDSIAKQLRDIEEKMKSAEKDKKDALKKVKDSEKKAKEIITDAKNEAILLSEKIMANNALDLEYLSKQYEEKSSMEARKSTKATINSVLNDNLEQNDITIDENQVVSIISKKVVA